MPVLCRLSYSSGASKESGKKLPPGSAASDASVKDDLTGEGRVVVALLERDRRVPDQSLVVVEAASTAWRIT